ncbi:hypothetical protein AK830_g268 [Neonectria ditissima]|uniref:Uncharacterized protein n=1 Tax=Neonectria ditissima TaxID=78410 RepID=A0A0P7B7Q1_9HYPO|nr:hypothetical protein AK830_g268 [Neonectria ditissima]
MSQITACPDNDGPTLYPHKTGCWYPQQRSDQNEFPPHPRAVNLVFRLELLNQVEVDIPLFLVNREAHSVAMAWLRDQDIKKHYDADQKLQYFSRPFDAKRDAVCIPRDKFYDFCDEPMGRLSDPEVFGRTFFAMSNMRRIAVPEGLLKTEASSMERLFDWFPDIRVIFIVVGRFPEFVDHDVEVQPRWELEKKEGRVYAWNLDVRRFEWEDGQSIGDEALLGQIEEAGKVLVSSLEMRKVRRFELRPVFAARKEPVL